MTPKRTVVVAVAVAVGVVASLLSYVFLNDAQTRAYHNAKLVPAYVIAKPVPRTLSGVDAVNGGYIVRKSVPAEFRPSTAITNLSLLQGKEAVAPFSIHRRSTWYPVAVGSRIGPPACLMSVVIVSLVPSND